METMSLSKLLGRKLTNISIALILFSLVVGFWLDWKGFAVNLLAGIVGVFIGFLIGIKILDRYLEAQKEQQWKQVDTLIKADFASLSLKFIAETTMFLASGGVTFPKSEKIKSAEKHWSFVLEGISFDDVHSAVLDTDNDDRESFVNSLQDMLENLLSLYTRHSSRFSSTDIETILELEGSLRSTINKMILVDDETALLNLADGNSTKVDLVWTNQVENTAKSLHETISLTIRFFGKFFPTAKES